MTHDPITVPIGESKPTQVNAWYDTKEGMEGRLKVGLEGLREIARARHQAGYDRKERMAEWCLLGMFSLDTCGNFSLISEGAPIDAYQYYTYEKPADVMARDEIERYTQRWVSTMGSCLPPVDGRCDRCGQGWDLKNVRDFIWLRPQGEPPVSRDRHKACHRLAIIEREREEIQAIVDRSEVPHTALHMIPNEYYPDPDIYGPWFMVETPAGRIKIGWRKRVINIDWKETGLNVQGSQVVDEPGITHGLTYVHAYGADKAVEALRKLWTAGGQT